MIFKPMNNAWNASRVMRLGVISLVFLCVSLAGFASAQAGGWSETVEAAKKEGRLVVHGASEVGILKENSRPRHDE